jgi:membrane-associated HD superfamily phosphohydrolase
METMYFVLGMLSIVAASVVAIVIWGLLKIKNQQRSINILQQRLDEMPKQFYDETRNITQTYDKRFDDVWGQFGEVRRDFGDARRDIHEMDKSILESSKSYADSRIDKLIDTYFDMVGAKKQIIK